MSDVTHKPKVSVSEYQPVSFSASKFNDPWLSAFLHVLQRIQYGHVTLSLPSGSLFEFGQPVAGVKGAQMDLHDIGAVKRFLKHSDIGLGESYMDGQWSSPDLDALMQVALLNEQYLKESILGGLLTKIQHLFALFKTRNTRSGSRRNIAHHYDLGNDFYRLWLDRTMTYSSALFGENDQSLAQAQMRKYQEIARIAGVEKGSKILEVGCGWGGFAEFAAIEYQGQTDGLTLSEEQLAFAKDRLSSQGLEKQARFFLRDYRDHHGDYDAIVSIEMFEAVGRENWDSYFQCLKQNLKAGRKAAVQVITIDENRYDTYLGAQDFIQKYIFPGGLLPSKTAFMNSARKNGFNVRICHEFGTDYADTLSQWEKDFQKNWQKISTLGYDTRFKRMWEFYLKYCEAGFRQKSLDVVIFELS
ncbi:SAM-dependent methyltransferase [Sneathiella aquimaris]|uniref:SAM-dependent methyltransferase n=1 Tax=Sneathiella aquimaris TaxID=2599305 RepID=UPI00146ECDEC|nr:cyclopropane-fatty-acyl-phospholipid synthase family protein [Sneathiella aquimaris]